MTNEENIENKNQNAEEISKIMAANMATNLADPDFLNRKELLQDKIARKVNAERKLRKAKEKETEEKEEKKE